MKYLTIVSMLVIVSGCSTLKPVELEPEELQQQISAGKITQPGDLVEVVTSDGMRHKFRVEAITENRIMGKHRISAESNIYEDIDILITDIVTLEIRVEEPEKTAALGFGTLGAIMLAIALTSPFIWGGGLH